jgi:hypothetical protein
VHDREIGNTPAVGEEWRILSDDDRVGARSLHGHEGCIKLFGTPHAHALHR